MLGSRRGALCSMLGKVPLTPARKLVRGYSMENVIAEREFEYQAPGAESPQTIVVRLGRPEPDGNDWRVPFELRGPGPDEVRSAAMWGVDSMQALVLALGIIRTELGIYARRGRLTWLGGDELGLPSPPPLPADAPSGNENDDE